MSHFLFGRDISRLSPIQFERLIKAKVRADKIVNFILHNYFKMLQEGWSPRYASKALFITSNQIDLMEKVRKNKDYIEISRDIGLKNMNPIRRSFKSQLTDDKIGKKKHV